MKNGELPVYPDPMRGAEQSFVNQSPSELPEGLTKREYFAAMAMQAILSNPSNNNLDLMGVNTAGPLGFIACNLAAKEAVQYADELLKALES